MGKEESQFASDLQDQITVTPQSKCNKDHIKDEKEKSFESKVLLLGEKKVLEKKNVINHDDDENLDFQSCLPAQVQTNHEYL